MLPATPTRCAAMPGGGPVDAERWAPSEPPIMAKWRHTAAQAIGPSITIPLGRSDHGQMAAHGCAGQRPTLLERRHGQSVAIVRALNRRRHRKRAGRLHRRRSAKPANSDRATSSAAPTSTARCRFSGVGRRPHRCAGTPSSGSSADFPRQRASWRDLLRRVGPASCRGAALLRRRSRGVQEGLRAAWQELLDPAKAR